MARESLMHTIYLGRCQERDQTCKYRTVYRSEEGKGRLSFTASLKRGSHQSTFSNMKTVGTLVYMNLARRDTVELPYYDSPVMKYRRKAEVHEADGTSN